MSLRDLMVSGTGVTILMLKLASSGPLQPISADVLLQCTVRARASFPLAQWLFNLSSLQTQWLHTIGEAALLQ